MEVCDSCISHGAQYLAPARHSIHVRMFVSTHLRRTVTYVRSRRENSVLDVEKWDTL